MIDRREDVAEKCEAYGIPDHMWGGVERYLFDRIPPGSFLMAVLENNLFEAFARADQKNVRTMRAWIHLIYNEFPISSFGSPETVQGWLEDRD